MQQSMTNHLGMEGDEFIGRERGLEIHKRGRKVHISRGKLMMIRSRGPNEIVRPYKQQLISISFFSKVLVGEASPPIWENLPEADQCRFSMKTCAGSISV